MRYETNRQKYTTFGRRIYGRGKFSVKSISTCSFVRVHYRGLLGMREKRLGWKRPPGSRLETKINFFFLFKGKEIIKKKNNWEGQKKRDRWIGSTYQTDKSPCKKKERVEKKGQFVKWDGDVEEGRHVTIETPSLLAEWRCYIYQPKQQPTIHQTHTALPLGRIGRPSTLPYFSFLFSN